MIFNPIFTGFVEAFIWTLIFVALLVLSYNAIPYVENKFFPVIDKKTFKVDYVSELSDDMVNIDLSFNKLRKCDPILERFSWYSSDENEYFERVHFTMPETVGDPSRPVGLNISKGWHVNLSDKSGFDKKQKVIFYHECNPFWVTRTEIIIPDAKNRRN
jgi:hypothetical protein